MVYDSKETFYRRFLWILQNFMDICQNISFYRDQMDYTFIQLLVNAWSQCSFDMSKWNDSIYNSIDLRRQIFAWIRIVKLNLSSCRLNNEHARRGTLVFLCLVDMFLCLADIISSLFMHSIIKIIKTAVCVFRLLPVTREHHSSQELPLWQYMCWMKTTRTLKLYPSCKNSLSMKVRPLL